ncbi:hypothetical protein OG742_41780 [Streptomyces sp. NBC_00828]|uniref:hypothetical protein n=1 Tax=Streptomyces sp. NBC_00828 TaxID=2903678 RepID=UPI003870B2AE
MSRVIGEVSMSLRRPDGKIDEDLVWSTTGIDVFEPSIPWRTFRWREGQKHYSGLYWSSVMRDHVVYESRLELTRLLYADFDQDVTAVFAQPFLLSTIVDGRRCRHVPRSPARTGGGVNRPAGDARPGDAGGTDRVQDPGDLQAGRAARRDRTPTPTDRGHRPRTTAADQQTSTIRLVQFIARHSPEVFTARAVIGDSGAVPATH